MFSKEKRCFFLLLAILCFFTGISQGQQAAVLKTESCTWEAGGEAVIAGTVTLEAAVTDAVWHLELKTSDPENSGTVVFTRINETNIRIRKQSDTLTQDAVSGDNTFQVSWYLPARITGLSGGEIIFRLETPEGKELASAKASVSMTDGAADPGIRLLAQSNQLINVLMIAAAVIWLAAVGRAAFQYLRRKKAAAE